MELSPLQFGIVPVALATLAFVGARRLLLWNEAPRSLLIAFKALLTERSDLRPPNRGEIDLERFFHALAGDFPSFSNLSFPM